jgi:hypothetical protein
MSGDQVEKKSEEVAMQSGDHSTASAADYPTQPEISDPAENSRDINSKDSHVKSSNKYGQQEHFAAWLLSENGLNYWIVRIAVVFFLAYVLACLASARILLLEMTFESFALANKTPQSAIAFYGQMLSDLDTIRKMVPSAFGAAAAVAFVGIISMVRSRRMNWLQMLLMIASITVLLTCLIVYRDSLPLTQHIKKLLDDQILFVQTSSKKIARGYTV